MTRYVVWLALFHGCVLWCGFKKLDPGSSMRLPGMTQYIAWWTCFLGTLSPFHLSTFKDPVDPVIRVLFQFILPLPFLTE